MNENTENSPIIMAIKKAYPDNPVIKTAIEFIDYLQTTEDDFTKELFSDGTINDAYFAGNRVVANVLLNTKEKMPPEIMAYALIGSVLGQCNDVMITENFGKALTALVKESYIAPEIIFEDDTPEECEQKMRDFIVNAPHYARAFYQGRSKDLRLLHLASDIAYLMYSLQDPENDIDQEYTIARGHVMQGDDPILDSMFNDLAEKLTPRPFFRPKLPGL